MPPSSTQISDRLRELTRPTGEEELLAVDYPRPRLRVPPWLAFLLAVAAVAGALLWLGLSSREVDNEYVGQASPSSAAPSELIVSVVGEVDHPGLVTLTPGARVADALALAQPRPAADLLALNQAQRLGDGEQIIVRAPGLEPIGDVEPTDGTDAKVSLNSATAAELEELKGVGEVTAAAIVAHREEIGGYSSVEQLMDVSGIGPAKFAQLKEQVQL